MTEPMYACTLCGGPTRYPGACWSCKQAYPHGARTIVGVLQRNGRVALRAECDRCGHRAHGVKNSDVEDISKVPIFRDNLRDNPNPPCVHCGSADGTESHHWAPRAIFPDADAWPTDYLCPPCHSLWHTTMRRAGGYSNRDQR